MKIYQILAISSLALTMAVANAQTPPTATPTTPVAKGKKARVGDPESNKLMRQAAKEIHDAVISMRSALPIYDGHRVKSIEEAHESHQDIQAAFGTKNAKNAAKPKVTDHVPSKAAPKKYTAAQIQASQAKMEAGLDLLNKAKTDLANAKPEYDGHRGAAIKELDEAISEAKTALKIHAAGTTTP